MLNILTRKKNKGRGRKRRRSSGRSAKRGKLDYRLLYIAGALLLFGLLMIFSASSVVAFHKEGSSFHYFIRQIVWIGGGLVAGFVAFRFPLKWLPKLALPLMLAAVASLLLVLVIAEPINGARRWIFISDFSFQPSEMAKLAFVIYLSAWLARPRQKYKSLRDTINNHITEDLLPFILWIGVICSLILLQPDLDTTVIIAATALAVYFVSGRDWIHNIGTGLIVGVAGLLGVVAAILAPYRLRRVQVYVEFLQRGFFTLDQKRNEAFQVWNGLLAIGNGGVFGVGYGNSTQKLFYLQETAWTDSIFAVIAEEFGLVGSVALIIAILYFMSVGVDIAIRSKEKFHALLAIGLTTWITLQAFLNIGANLAVVPFGGIPLPFLSYGGSNTMVVMIAVGLLLNISTYLPQKRHKR